MDIPGCSPLRLQPRQNPLSPGGGRPNSSLRLVPSPRQVCHATHGKPGSKAKLMGALDWDNEDKVKRGVAKKPVQQQQPGQQ
eukprot:CAMPEP_0202864482 /NCGR_PEP_ID=MMETSP1391-20130828/4703_1 /ASSEMBLY_ACC=CAM_ASM_000867 /TAXON_ID=1034604 /ORGANISM="Chlamydomonas leiostraca, Strain SAG 11-49" /LENGTH=81 /DNA_ID=CAMNT_0049544223 /DNA_START=96 /DNA_END=338 /DNA_ORIENTATION=-